MQNGLLWKAGCETTIDFLIIAFFIVLFFVFQNLIIVFEIALGKDTQFA